jgi:hypothetical protein
VGNWAGEKENYRSAGPTTFWQGLERNNMHQTTISSYTWRGYLAGKSCLIIVELIAQITGLPIWGMDPALFLDDKAKEKALVEEMKKKYGTSRGKRGIIIKRINNKTT